MSNQIVDDETDEHFMWHWMFNGKEGYFCHCFTVILEESEELGLRFHTELFGEKLGREAIFPDWKLCSGMDIAHAYQPRDFQTGKFLPRVQIMGIHYSKLEKQIMEVC